jgi:predicted transposase/invertase (TIGR01784 family)
MAKSQRNQVRPNKDTLWKGIIEDLIEEFLLYFYPEWASAEVDFIKGCQFLEKELTDIALAAPVKQRIADLLVKVPLKNGEEAWMLIHVEVQGYRDEAFEERMFTYFYRIKDRWKKDVAALAILTDQQKNYHPQVYRYEQLNTRLTYEFDTIKVIEKEASELYKPGNPFSFVLLAARNAIESNQQGDQIVFRWKRDMIEALAKAGFPKEKVRQILSFIRNYVHFRHEDFEKAFEKEIESYFPDYTTMGIEQAIIKDAFTKGEASGIKKGQKLGLRRGEELGLRKGEELGEEKHARKSIKRMLAKGVDDATIREFLGVEQALIDEVRKEIS